jgi:PKD repeat protein
MMKGGLSRALRGVALLLLAFAAHAQVLPIEKLHRLTAAEANVQAVFKGFDRVRKESVYELVLTNVSTAPLAGPLYVTIEGLNTPGVTVKDPTGVTTTGVPYFLMSASSALPGAQLTQAIAFANPQNVRFTFTVAGYSTPSAQSPPLAVEITHPATLITVGATPLTVEGTLSDAAATLTINGVPVSHSGGTFHANVALIEGHNAIIARATNARGEEATATISVSLDMTPPYVTVEAPLDGSVVHEGVINVSGLVNDIVRGTVSDGQAQVTVNGRPASVANRSYLTANIPLIEGANTLHVEASDQVGNTGSIDVHVTYVVPVGARIEISDGQNQEAEIRRLVERKLAVVLRDATGQPVAGKPVVFRVNQGDGAVSIGASDEGIAAVIVTNEDGVAATRYRLGSRAGVGNQRVTAKAIGFEGEALFIASATPRPPNKISVDSGNNQRGTPHQPLPLPFVIVLTDQGANVIANTDVRFAVTAGGGAFQNGETSVIATTDSDGRASAKLTLGDTLGLDTHRVSVTLAGTDLSAGFTASALQSGPPGQTSISGVVLDNQDRPLPNVTLRVDGTTREAKTDAQGRFKVTEAPVGPVHLIADGSTTTTPGEWPTLPYNLVTIAGADNPLASPVYLVKLDTARAVTVGAVDKEITLPEVPGFKLSVKAGSVTFPNGDRVGQLSVTPVNVAKIPMAPPNGMQPQFIVTIQPSGARFDPPAPLQLPNVDGHPPGAQVEMYSFDHDLEEFVSIGLGTVSSDGTTIASNPGIGVIKAGWHCGSQPGGNGCAADCGECNEADDQCNCVAKTSEPTDDPPPDDQAGDECTPQCVRNANGRTASLVMRAAAGGTCCVGTGGNPITIGTPTAQVDGKPEHWRLLQSGQATFAFSGASVVKNCASVQLDWDFGDGGKGSGGAVSHTYTRFGEFTVTLTASCAGCTTQKKTAKVKAVVLEASYQLSSLTPANRKRTTIGVAEEAIVSVKPAKSVVWTVSANGQADEFSEGDTLYRARDTQGPETLKVKAPLLDETTMFTFDVLAPSDITMTWDGTSIPTRDNFPGPLSNGDQGAQMRARITFQPTTVSFYNVEFREVSGGPSNVQGYYLNAAHPAPRHTPTVEWSPITEDNHAGDNIARWGEPQDVVNGVPAGWADGVFDWDIPVDYRLKGGQIVRRIRNIVQHHGLSKDGTMRIEKAGACVSRKVTDSNPGTNCGARP